VEVGPEQSGSWREAARRALKYPPVTLTGRQALAVGEGFRRFARKSGLGVWACSILPEHVHLVLARHRYKIEQAVSLLKGEATRRLRDADMPPRKAFRGGPNKRLPSLWAENQWKVYLDSEEGIDNAIRYVEENPVREGKPRQSWGFVQPFAGVREGGWITYS